MNCRNINSSIIFSLDGSKITNQAVLWAWSCQERVPVCVPDDRPLSSEKVIYFLILRPSTLSLFNCPVKLAKTVHFRIHWKTDRYPCQDSYLKKRESSWETDLVLAPPCGESKILSLVKTSRKDSKLRGLTRLSYSLDLRKDEMKTGDYPTLRRVFLWMLNTDWLIVSANGSTRKPDKDLFLEEKEAKTRILKLKKTFKKRSTSMETLLSEISRTHMIIYLSRYEKF